MRVVLAFLKSAWPFIAAAVLAALGSFLSMGLLGLALYWLVSPGLDLRFPPLPRWDQSTVWPMLIAVPLLWSPAFLIAGVMNWLLARRGWGRWSRRGAWLGLLWLAALAAWWAMLELNPTLWSGAGRHALQPVTFPSDEPRGLLP